MRLNVNQIEIEVEDTGEATRPAVLLIMGLGMQLIAWPPQLLQSLDQAGFRVIRFDNRDAGLSTGFDDWEVPNLLWNGLKHRLGWSMRRPYSMQDMARDALGVLDALRVTRAHVIGVSMGGMIAQLMALRHPQKTRSLISLMSTTSDPSLPRSDPKAQAALMSKPADEDRETVIDHTLKMRAVNASPGYPEDQDELRARIAMNYDRSYYPEGVLRQWAAIMASPPRTEMLKRLDCPALVIHGADDLLIRPDAGRHTAACIMDSELEIVPGWGHNMPIRAVEAITAPMIHFMRRHNPAD